jgi:hypothetical protein
MLALRVINERSLLLQLLYQAQYYCQASSAVTVAPSADQVFCLSLVITALAATTHRVFRAISDSPPSFA